MTFGWAMGEGSRCLLAVARNDSGTVYYVGLAIIVAIMIGTIIAFYRTWAEIHEDLEPDTPQDLLESFRDAHAAGEIDDRELERVQRLLSSGEEQATATSPPRSARGPNPGDPSGIREGLSAPADPDGQQPIPE